MTRNRPANFVCFDYLYTGEGGPKPDGRPMATLARMLSLESLLLPHEVTVPGKSNVGGLFQALPFKDEVFDEVIEGYSMMHVGDGLPETLAEAIRVTKPGGHVQITPRFRRRGVSNELEDLGRTRRKRPIPGALSLASVPTGAGHIASTINDSIRDHDISAPEALKIAGALTLVGVLFARVQSVTNPSVLIINRDESLTDPLMRDELVAEIVQTYELRGKRVRST